jgi:threonine dehydratase
MVIAPIGGGGMISGTCLTLSNLAPEERSIAAEPEQADDAYRSFKAGHIIADDAPVTIADGLKVPLKELTWHFVSNYVTDILTAQRAGDHRRDEADLAAHEDRDGAVSCAVPLATILKNKDGSRASASASSSPAAMSISTRCPGSRALKPFRRSELMNAITG